MSSTEPMDFSAVLKQEEAAINGRRKLIAKRPNRKGLDEPRTVKFSASAALDERDNANPVVDSGQPLVGLALSGGGIRSAAYCLGVLQGIDAVVPNKNPQILDSVDYLSTVSGGGYAGISFAAAMSRNGDFPFESKLDQAETIETQHLRDYSNYLLPSGGSDVVAGLIMLSRGLLINAIILLSVISLCASVTVFLYPTDDKLTVSYLWPSLKTPFGTALSLAIAYAVIQVLYAIVAYLPRSKVTSLTQREGFSFFFSSLCIVLLAVAAIEFEGYVLKGAIDAAKLGQHLDPANAGPLGRFLHDHIYKYRSPWILMSVAVAGFGTFGSKLLKVVQATIGDKSWKGFLKHWGSRVAIYVGALLVPLGLWLIYSYFCYLAIQWTAYTDTLCINDNAAVACDFVSPAPDWLRKLCSNADFTISGYFPGWLQHEVTGVSLYSKLYFYVFVVAGIVSLLVSPNANSLHGYYRDRLSRAFLWSRAALISEALKRPTLMRQSDDAERAADETKLSHLRNVGFKQAKSSGQSGGGHSQDHWPAPVTNATEQCGKKPDEEEPLNSNGHAPYLLVNTSVNLEASKYLNRRGRNADSFFFSPLCVGSEATGYVDTVALEERDANIDLATVMAISGAAASANMGFRLPPCQPRRNQSPNMKNCQMKVYRLSVVKRE